MPSLFRYFVVVGSMLLGLLWLVDYLVGPAPTPVAAATSPKIVIQHDPRASLIERLRDEEAARRAAERGEPAPVAPAIVEAAAPAPVPVAEPRQAQADERPQIVAPVALVAPAGPEVQAPDAAQAERLKVLQARKARIARERARAKRQEEAASRQQDQFFFGEPRPAYRQGNVQAYAPSPVFPPFGPGRTW